MTSDLWEEVRWAAAFAPLAFTLVLLVRRHRAVATLRRKIAVCESEMRLREEELEHLATVRLPEVLDPGGADPSTAHHLFHPGLEGTAYAQSLRTVAELFVRSEESARKRADEAAKTALKASVRSLQGLAHEQQQTISQMQESHDDPRVLQGLLEVDHMNAQLGRRAQAIAILCGAWPGRQRAAAALLDVVRGATSRIRDYRRVEVHTHVDSAVISRAVEPVVLAVAELLDNAARHSQPNTRVQVGVVPAHNGVSIVIDDAGVGLHPRDIQRSVRLLSPTENPDITRLGNPPQFGFALIGVLAARYGFSVSVDTRSPYGGVRAIVYLPAALLTSVDDEGRPPQTAIAGTSHLYTVAPVSPEVPAPSSFPAAASLPASPVHAPPHPLSTDPGHHTTALPQRRRRRPVQQDPAAGPPPHDVAAPTRSAQNAAAVMGAFARGTRSGRDLTSDFEGPHNV
ncbi:ATP-binding protein [Streptomyces sp. NPDC087659]|uniref:ATP-binding protein n=1 Tax=Streptomyces sp. NPDC087659 TaxID=3365801 RepID=UPI0037F66A3E